MRALVTRAAIPLLAIFTALLVAAGVLLLQGTSPITAFVALGEGAFGTQTAIIETLIKTTPFILAGLGIALAFRGGLFNIGVQGQLFMGSIFAVVVGYSIEAPPIIHIPLAMLAGMVGGGLWAAIPGYLKARNGAHEVITTIMLNFIALFFVSYMVSGPIKDPNPTTVQSLPLMETAHLARIFGRLHWGFLIAILMAVLAYIFLFRTTWGFSLRTTGQNPNAAEYAGIRPKWQYVLSFLIAGGLAGLAGSMEVQGLTRVLSDGVAAGYGFDAIAVSLLALNHPLAIIPSAFLFGALKVGGDFLRLRAGLSVHLVSVFQALILLFVAAPAIVRYIFRLKETYTAGEEGGPLTSGWGS